MIYAYLVIACFLMVQHIDAYFGLIRLRYDLGCTTVDTLWCSYLIAAVNESKECIGYEWLDVLLARVHGDDPDLHFRPWSLMDKVMG